jgi:hypothetical protein
MRLKQGRAQEAVDAYRQGITLYRGLVRATRSDTAQATLAELHTKLAQAYLVLGDHDQAYQTLKAVRLTATEPAKKPKETAPPAHEGLPGKLIVSAPKHLLDQVGAGQMSFADFQRAASVQYLPSAVADTSAPQPPPGRAPGGDKTR